VILPTTLVIRKSCGFYRDATLVEHGGSAKNE
jgi:hypothetical protein